MGVTRIGKEEVAAWLAGSSAVAPTHTAFGTDNTAPNEEDTTLTVENTREAIDTAVRSGREVKFTTIMSTITGDGVTYKEIGLFNANSDGDMFVRNTFADVDKTSSFEIHVVFTLRVD